MKPSTYLFALRVAKGAGGALLGFAGGVFASGLMRPVGVIWPGLPVAELAPAALLGALVGFGFGFLAWPDRSSRNLQDPVWIAEPGVEAPLRSVPPRSHTRARRLAAWCMLLATPFALTGALVLTIELALRSAERPYQPRNGTLLTLESAELVGTYWDLRSEPGITLRLNADGTFVEEKAAGSDWPGMGWSRSGTWTLEEEALCLHYEGTTEEPENRRLAPVAYESRVALLDRAPHASFTLVRKIQDPTGG